MMSSPVDKRPDLIARYLAAVERQLPEAQAKDIASELREAITAKAEAKEDELGRALNADETAEILKGFGAPTVVASRYCGREYLIGPQLYPWFWPVQRVAMGVVLVMWVIFSVIDVLDSSRPIVAFLGNLWDAVQLVLIAFAAVTAAFVVAENTPAKIKVAECWDPKTLPHDNIRKPKSLFDTLFSILFDVVFILWWVKWVDFPNVVGRGSEAVELHLSSVWAPLWTPILALALVQAAVHIGDVFYPGWSRLRSFVAIAGHVAGIGVIWVLLQSGPLVEIVSAPGNEVRAGQVTWWLDGPFRWLLVFGGVMSGLRLAGEVWRQVSATRPAPPAGLPA